MGHGLHALELTPNSSQRFTVPAGHWMHRVEFARWYFPNPQPTQSVPFDLPSAHCTHAEAPSLLYQLGEQVSVQGLRLPFRKP
jgi:hypothetical protein